MYLGKTFLSTTVALGLASAAAAQAPIGVPGGTVPPPTLPLGIAPYPAVPDGPTVWSKLGISSAQIEYRHRQACRTPGGQLLGKLFNPISVLSGGLIPPFCPNTPSLAELMDPGAVGAAAKVKQDRANAEERMKAVRYLGSVDCHYWPEAEEALIGALRGDRNECVRYEAAVVLGSGCCCTTKVIVALSHTVSCSDKDGFPYEKSARVRAAAANALDHCLSSSCCAPELPGLPSVEQKKDDKKSVEPGKEEKEKGTSKLGDPDYPKFYYTSVAAVPRNQIALIGRKALEIGNQIGYTITSDINATDYAAVGLPAGSEATVVKKPNNLWDLYNHPGTPASVAKAPMTPPVNGPVAVNKSSTVFPRISSYSSDTVAPPMSRPTSTAAGFPLPRQLPDIEQKISREPVSAPPVPVQKVQAAPPISVPASMPVSKSQPITPPLLVVGELIAPEVNVPQSSQPSPVVVPSSVPSPAPAPASKSTIPSAPANAQPLKPMTPEPSPLVPSSIGSSQQ
ncbi:MAG: hypothetical protein U0798_16015 [Gemmataceae bacterium]